MQWWGYDYIRRDDDLRMFNILNSNSLSNPSEKIENKVIFIFQFNKHARKIIIDIISFSTVINIYLDSADPTVMLRLRITLFLIPRPIHHYTS